MGVEDGGDVTEGHRVRWDGEGWWGSWGGTGWSLVWGRTGGGGEEFP